MIRGTRWRARIQECVVQSCLSVDLTVTSQLYCQIVYEPKRLAVCLCIDHCPALEISRQRSISWILIWPFTGNISTDPLHMYAPTEEGQGSAALLLCRANLKCSLICQSDLNSKINEFPHDEWEKNRFVSFGLKKKISVSFGLKLGAQLIDTVIYNNII